MKSPRTTFVVFAFAFLALAVPAFADVQSDVAGLFNQANAVANANDFTQGERVSLVTKLIGALQSLEKGNAHTARNQVEAFVNEVQAMERSGRIGSGDAAALLTAADAIIQQLPDNGGKLL